MTFLFSSSLIWMTPSLVKEPWMALVLFSFIASNPMFSFTRDKFSLIKLSLLLPSWYFSFSELANFFRLTKAFFSTSYCKPDYVLFLHLVVRSDLPNLSHAFNALKSTSASISSSTDDTVGYKFRYIWKNKIVPASILIEAI